MIGYLKGEVIQIYKDSIVIDVNNVGYHVITSLPYDYKISEAIEMFIHTYVKEDQISLFGFKTNDQKDLFLKLISVNGIGPKTAITMLSSLSSNIIIEAIEMQKVDILKKIPGIGPKAAGRIILDLKGKLVVNENNLNNDLDDAIEALIALGYRQNEINKIEKELTNEILTTEEYVKKALQLLLK